jgi:hypothetical protein
MLLYAQAAFFFFVNSSSEKGTTTLVSSGTIPSAAGEKKEIGRKHDVSWGTYFRVRWVEIVTVDRQGHICSHKAGDMACILCLLEKGEGIGEVGREEDRRRSSEWQVV